MVSFWDTSAIVPLIVQEEHSPHAMKWHAAHADRAIWILAPVEAYGSLCRLCREKVITDPELDLLKAKLDEIVKSMIVVKDVESVKLRAERLLRLHPLRSADALQLAAALVVAQELPEGHYFLTFDKALGTAAKREGFGVD